MNKMDFKNKVVLITGGAGGIGRAVARIFLELEAKVSICDINEAEGKRVLEELEKDFGKKKVTFSKCDVSKEEDFKNSYEECENSLGAIDILINNAAILSNDFRKTTEVIQYGTIIGTKLAMEKMGKQNGGRGGFVVNISSVAGLITYSSIPYYSAAKAAVVNYSRVLGNYFHKNYSGVSVLCLCPSGVDTPLMKDYESLRKEFQKFEVQRNIKEKSNDKLSPEKVGEVICKLIEDNKSGEVAVICKSKGFYYVPLSSDK